MKPFWNHQTQSLALGQIFKVRLEIHVSFLLMVAIFAGASAYGDGVKAAVSNTLFLLAAFLFVVIHEFGHVGAAAALGIRTRKVSLFPFGGIAFLARFPAEPWKQIVVALAGPMTNIALFLALVAIMAHQDIDMTDWSHPLVHAAVINFVLAAFNLVPAFPMDGGRIFRAILQAIFNSSVADSVSAVTGQVLGAVFMGMAVYEAAPMLFMVGAFVFIASPMETGRHPFWFLGYPRKDPVPV